MGIRQAPARPGSKRSTGEELMVPGITILRRDFEGSESNVT